MERGIKLLLVALAAVVIAVVLVHRHDPRRPARTPSAAEDVDAKTAPAAPDLSLRTLDGKTVELRSLRGKVVAVNFWATWCGPCRVEMPRLAKIWQAQHDHCFELLGVAGMSPRGETEQLARGLPFPILYDETGDALDAWSVHSFPRTFVVDPQGRVRQEFPGLVDEQELAQAIDRLLPDSCPGRS